MNRKPTNVSTRRRPASTRVPVTVRLPQEVVARIDMELNDRDVKTFVDSRVDIFEYAGVLQDYLDLLGLKQPKTILDKYKIRFCLLNRRSPMVFVLGLLPDWKVVYSDDTSIILARNQPAG